MPRLDGTGPLGEGSRTGRGLGNCNPNNKEKINNNDTVKAEDNLNNQNTFKKPLYGRGLGLGRRNGREFRNRGR